MKYYRPPDQSPDVSAPQQIVFRHDIWWALKHNPKFKVFTLVKPARKVRKIGEMLHDHRNKRIGLFSTSRPLHGARSHRDDRPH